MAVSIFTKVLKNPVNRKFVALSGQCHNFLENTRSWTLYSSVSAGVHPNCPRSNQAPMSSSSQRPLPQTNSLYRLHSHQQGLLGLFYCETASSLTHLITQSEQRRFYQAALRPRLICPGCYFVWRHGRKHVECSDHPRHKQMKRVATRKMWKEDYSKGDWVRALDFHKVHYRQASRHVDSTAMSHNWLAGKLGTEL